MAEQKSNSGPRNGSRGGRRRYFRRREGGDKANSTDAPTKAPAKKTGPAATDDSAARDGRVGRRRRRTRSRAAAPQKTEQVTAESIVNLDDYRPPSEVFIYTHITRPGSRDSYEFRADHFSKVGRRLEDYDIDFSMLFVGGDPGEGSDPPQLVSSWATATQPGEGSFMNAWADDEEPSEASDETPNETPAEASDEAFAEP